MRTAILTNGQALHIEDANGTVLDDFGYSWVSVKGKQKAWHFRTPPNMKHTNEEYDKRLERAELDNRMSQWHIDTQDMLQKIWPEGIQEFSIDRTRIADFKTGYRVFEAQYSNMSDSEPYERTKYWSEQGYEVTWILAAHILDEPKYEPKYAWHGEAFETANFSIKNLNKWLKPLEIKGTRVLAILPLFQWGNNIKIKKQIEKGYDFEEVGEECIYRFYDAKYNEKYKNWMVYGGCTFEWRHALEAKFRMY